MDEVVYNALSGYFNLLEKFGYASYEQAKKLLVLIFYRDFAFKDYRGILSKCDYRCIEEALNCLFGSTCLISYPEYEQMGKLHLGEVTELAQRVKSLEDTKVLKTTDADDEDSDVTIVEVG